MRLVSFIQVLLLLAILAYLSLFTLENPVPARLPLPFGRGELSLSVGMTVALFALIGAAYAALLLLPPVWRGRLSLRRERRERRAVEERLTATLQARLGAIPTAVPAVSLLPGPDLPTPGEEPSA
ncbi:lipopolysaccharide assembly protein LapA domain-containing protein [Deinococcus frigens]|uniref:lipopolysaccharide assembly protein LapA domain-containing protein n=1 Tax=Deinococcus frigens TaxID=249403 RepID=UPI0004959ACF|nr:lipopolysaccharide assembly protein LapA domain-containing protein [Deinococcus frigens]